jgi:hypothetical protein
VTTRLLLLLLVPALLLLGCTCWLLRVGRNAQCRHHWAGCSNGRKHTCVAAFNGAKQHNMLEHVAGLSSSSTCPVTHLAQYSRLTQGGIQLTWQCARHGLMVPHVIMLVLSGIALTLPQQHR